MMYIQKKIFYFIVLGIMTVLVNAAELKQDGWNLISVCQDINQADIDMREIEEIQNQDGLSIYTGEGAEFSNLHVLEAGYGYWIKASAGTEFDGKTATLGVVKPLKREGWTLMAACENIAKDDINTTYISEIQAQDGNTIYIGEWAEQSNLDMLDNGYGYWVNGEKGTLFTSQKRNISPLADGGENQDVGVGDIVTLDASLSSDSDGNIVSYEWKEGSNVLSNNAVFTKSDFSAGTHILTLVVMDNKGATSSDDVVVVVASQANLKGVSTKVGNIEVSLSWSDSSIDMDLEVDVPDGIMDIQDSSQLLEHFFSNNVTTVGSHAVRIKYKGDVDETKKEIRDVMVTIKVPDSSEARVVNLKTIDSLQNGHIADIVITKDKIEFVPQDEFTRESTVIYEQQSSGAGSDYVTTESGESNSGSWSSGSQYSSGWSASVTEQSIANADDFISKIIWNISQILLGGPVVDATVEVYELSDYDIALDEGTTPIFTTKSSAIASIYAGGVVLIPKEIKNTLASNKLYVVKAYGGMDIDANSDSEVDSTPTPNMGTIHAVLRGEEIQTIGFKVNILTEMVYQLSKNLFASYTETVASNTQSIQKTASQTEDSNEALETLLEKLKEITQMLLEEDMDASGEINSLDALKWVPYSDKQRLLKDYNVNFLPIIKKLQKGEDIFEESYKVASTPIVSSSKFEVKENREAGFILGKIPTVGVLENPITGYRLSGHGAESFVVTEDGNLTLASGVDLDYEVKRIYDLTIVASNVVGDSPEVKVYVVVTADGSPLLGTLNSYVFEDAIAGSKVGKIAISEGNPITEMRLEGRDAKHFNIDISGVITVSQTADIKLEHGVYNFEAVASNSIGESAPVAVRVEVHSSLAKLSSFSVRVTDDVPSAQVIGKIGYAEGSSSISSFNLSGIGVENFRIDSVGNISIAENADINYSKQESYTLQVTATNGSGESYPANIYVTVLSSMVAETLNVTGLNTTISFNTQSPIAKVAYSFSLHAPETFTLSGEGASDFIINSEGYITLSSSADLSHKIGQSYNLKVIAFNDFISSEESSVVINIADDVPSLTSSRMYVMDGVASSETLGKVGYSIGVSAMVSFELSGAGAEKFNIDTQGIVTVASSVIFDFELTSLYNLTVTGTNALGRTTTASLQIHVLDDAPIIQGTTLTVIENTEIGTQLGQLLVTKIGKGEIRFFTLYGEGADKFAITKEGVIQVVGEIDYEIQNMFTLQASANNAYDGSERVDVQVRVLNLADGEPVLKATDLSIDENSDITSEVGTVEIVDMGKSAITSMQLIGSEKENFTIDTEGVIRTAKILDYEVQNLYALKVSATNDIGQSEEVDLTININNIVDSVPLLSRPDVTHVREDVLVGYEIQTIVTNGTNDDENLVNDYAIVGGNTNNDFNITNEGVIYTLNGLDFERTEEYVLEVQAQNDAGESIRINVVVNVDDIVDIPEGLSYEAINNLNEKVEVVYGDYKVKLYSDQNISANPQLHHIGVIANVNGGETPLLSIQENYEGTSMVFAVYDVSNQLVGISNEFVLARRMVVPVETVE